MKRIALMGLPLFFAIVSGLPRELRAADMHESSEVSQPATDAETGVRTYRIRSAFTGGENHLDVLLPDDYDDAKRYRVLYVLPVMPGTSTQFGDGLERLLQLDLHNAYDLILARPRFDTTPWFGNHATDPSIRHERYMNEVIVPLIDRDFASFGDKDGRLLIGYSKSGWGALSLILRNPETYGYAAGWDNPLAIALGHFGTDQHFGTEEQFREFSPLEIIEQIDAKRAGFAERQRIAFLGKNLFGTWTGGGQGNPDVDDTAAGHAALVEAGIEHFYSDQLKTGHHWDGGWVRPAVEALIAMAERGEPKSGVYFAADFEASGKRATAASLGASTSVGQWIVTRQMSSRVVVDEAGEEQALLVRGAGGTAARMFLDPAEPMPRNGPLRIAFDVALRGGYGKDPATEGHGGNRNYVIAPRDAFGRPICRALVIGLGKFGRVGYLDEAGQMHVVGPRIKRNNTDTYDPKQMRRFELVLRRDAYDLVLDGKKIAADLPLYEDAASAGSVHDVMIEGTNYAAKAYFDNIELSAHLELSE